MDPGVEFDISIYLYLQILFQKKNLCLQNVYTRSSASRDMRDDSWR